MPGPRVSFVSLGCPKNLVDSEKMLGLLAEAGCAVVAPGLPADVMVVNTCGFLSASRDEALDILRDAADQKRRGSLRRLVVAGCLAQRDGQGLVDAVPEIDALVGVNNRADVVEAVLAKRPVRRGGRAGAGRAAALPVLHLGDYHPMQDGAWSDRARLRLTPRHYAYLRISEGCDQKCTFCTIPSIRGPMHSKSPDEIEAEARELIADGASELLLIGQDTTSYGRDRGAAGGLASLLRRLDRLEGLRWLRLMYVYPTEVDAGLIEAIAGCERVVKYVDIPLQHSHDRVLKAMHRRIDRAATERLLGDLRRAMPEVTIRTTFIVGFPGETATEFDDLLAFVGEQQFDMVGAFAFSSEPGTPAGRMKRQLPEREKQARVAALMESQRAVAYAKAAARRGQTFEVVIDGFGRDGVYPARHAGQAPDIDSVTHVEGGEFDPGEFVRVRGTGSRGYDVLARPARQALPVLR
ncbi:MAG: 30S ribosomal protein S12 methylthiotransferase RimO [Phycisphaerae bacterium]